MAGMHWVAATTPDGRVSYINLAAVPTMMDRTDDAGAILFLGGVGINPNGGASYATTLTKETPAELLALPIVDPALVPKRASKAQAKPAPKRRRR